MSGRHGEKEQISWMLRDARRLLSLLMVFIIH
jgi:hypothetical protein